MLVERGAAIDASEQSVRAGILVRAPGRVKRRKKEGALVHRVSPLFAGQERRNEGFRGQLLEVLFFEIVT